MRLLFPKKATQYLFFEMFPSLIIGILVFLSIMIMFQAIHYTEFVLVHGVELPVVGKMLLYICISFLPALLPMALLFSILMTYGRLSQDSEIVALKAAGYNTGWILLPALFLGALVSLISAQTGFHLAPWGNRQFEILISKLEQTKASATIREGTFSEGFFDLVVYAKEVDTKNGFLKKIFIYDERDSDLPLTIISKEGRLLQDSNQQGRSVYLRLLNGDIHKQGKTHTKIKYDSFDIRLFDPIKEQMREKSPSSLMIEEISSKLSHEKLKDEDRKDLLVEYHKRWAISLLCLVFSALGVALGTSTNSRHTKSNGLVLSLIVVVAYWAIYISCEGSARSGNMPVAPALWAPNILFLGFTLYRLRKIWD